MLILQQKEIVIVRFHIRPTNTTPPTVHHTESTLHRAIRRTLAQLKIKSTQINTRHHYVPYANQKHTQPHTNSTASIKIKTKHTVMDMWTANCGCSTNCIFHPCPSYGGPFFSFLTMHTTGWLALLLIKLDCYCIHNGKTQEPALFILVNGVYKQ